jgi:hypothetical protein
VSKASRTKGSSRKARDANSSRSAATVGFEAKLWAAAERITKMARLASSRFGIFRCLSRGLAPPLHTGGLPISVSLTVEERSLRQVFLR